ncbi:LemA family protein [Spiroplasma endosymbiont of Labia minor]|uniref:LemA family protein n=1 Tax=Spiroplasma endosymbiont of Labia minor TaxID=3066305 RepID=UPI0030D501C1
MAEFNPTPTNIEENVHSSFFGKFFVYFWFILIIPIFIYIGTRNNLIRNREKIEETASGIDVQLKKRVDMLTKLVDSTKQYMNYEKSTLESIVALRSKSSSLKANNFEELNDSISNQVGKINVLLENYPDLKVNTTVVELQKGIKDCEDNISAARRFYNSSVRSFNSTIKTWPSSVAASALKMHTYLYFESSDQDRQDVKIDLS